MDIVGGDGHHFRVVQLPYNLSLQDAATTASQIVKGKRMSLLSAAQQLGISVVASASLMQVRATHVGCQFEYSFMVFNYSFMVFILVKMTFPTLMKIVKTLPLI